MASDYKAILQALPEPIRTRLLKGTFVAEKAIEPGAVIPLEWVVSAQRAWTVMSPGRADALGVSAATGVAVTPRHGKWFGPSRLLWAEAPQEGAVVAERLGELAQGGRIQVELDERGATILDAARRRGLPALPLDGMARSTARERTGRFGFADARSEWWWKLREALDPDSRSAIQIAPDAELAAELAAPHWRVGSRGIEIEGPVDIIRRLGRPADKAESLVRAFAGAERD